MDGLAAFWIGATPGRVVEQVRDSRAGCHSGIGGIEDLNSGVRFSSAPGGTSRLTPTAPRCESYAMPKPRWQGLCAGSAGYVRNRRATLGSGLTAVTEASIAWGFPLRARSLSWETVPAAEDAVGDHPPTRRRQRAVGRGYLKDVRCTTRLRHQRAVDHPWPTNVTGGGDLLCSKALLTPADGRRRLVSTG